MTDHTLTPTQLCIALSEIRRRIAVLDWTAPVSAMEIDRLHRRMPPRHPDEPLADWLRRGVGPAAAGPGAAAATPIDHQGPAQVIAFVPRPGRPARLIGEALAWAAAELDSSAPPLPERLTIGNKAFTAAFMPADGSIRVEIQALGRVLVRLRRREIAVTGPGGLSEVLTTLTLGPRGEGHFEIPDTPQARRLLLRLQVWEIEPA